LVKENSRLFYPNPAKGQIHFDNQENSSLTIFDAMGKLMLQKSINSVSESVDINSLKQGIYIVKLRDENANLQQHRLIVK